MPPSRPKRQASARAGHFITTLQQEMDAQSNGEVNGDGDGGGGTSAGAKRKAASNSKQGAAAKAEGDDYEVVQTKDGGYKRRRIGLKSWQYMCGPHGKTRGTCVECGGSSICQHKRQRSKCVECGGSSICQHKRRRSQCVECGGGEIC